MSSLLERIKNESQTLIPTIIYFWIAFVLIHFTQGLLLRPGAHRYYTYLDVMLGAIVVSCIIVFINTLSLMNIFSNRPLAYNIAWKFFIYSLAILLFRVIEFFIFHLFHSRDLFTTFFKLKMTLASPIFWAIEMWLILIFFIYVAFNEFIRAVGRDKICALVFG